MPVKFSFYQTIRPGGLSLKETLLEIKAAFMDYFKEREAEINGSLLAVLSTVSLNLIQTSSQEIITSLFRQASERNSSSGIHIL